MTNPAAFRDRTNWLGGYYELAIEIGSTEDARVEELLRALWAAAEVQGCFGCRDREPEEQESVPCGLGSLAEFGNLYGRVRLPTGEVVVCGCVAIRGGDDSSDWLDFYVPLGALDHAGVAYGGDGPFFRSGVLDDWLADIGARAFEGAPFALGVIGFEVSGCAEAATLAGDLPSTRGIGYLVPRGGLLRYGAANE
ncbi:hypothetical protein STRCI_007694 [Streptomyces cinnabarinus]|uniref:Knr4/Smi1-like domain-containing protein n=1 Tax=Streptomyces cinnabarinus TaxID=67287 RepID=A0ABY7KNJ6_9ACTN|nr:hypothetical protein [Streptomyces cinnabarinus]WAZ26144.1 hypothetical protein STRCI_007694 [Streptomyces cinnabarinus]